MIKPTRDIPKEPEQEPVAWLDPWTQNNVTTDYDAYGKHGIPLYTTPPQRKPLTDEQIADLFSASLKAGEGHSVTDWARRIEAAHGIKE